MFEKKYAVFYALFFVLTVVSASAGAVSGECIPAPSNFLRNSSFRDISDSGIPVYWGSSHWGLGGADFASDPAKFSEHFRIEAPRVEGSGHSVLISNPHASAPPGDLRLTSVWTRVDGGQHTLSAYARSSGGGRPFRMEIVNRTGGRISGEVFTASEEWERFSITAKLSRGNVMVRFYPTDSGEVWFDDAQLERGSAVSPYAESERDTALPPGFSCPVLSESDGTLNVLDGREFAENAFSHALTRMNVWGCPELGSRFMIARDEANLYVRVVNKYRREVHHPPINPETLWRSNDTIAVLVSPAPDGDPYYFMMLDRHGNRFDARSTDPSWDGTWLSRTFVQDNKWTADYVIPFHSIVHGGAHETWRVNIFRENTFDREHSAFSPAFSMVHDIDAFGYMSNMPASILREYDFELSEIALNPAGKNSYDLILSLANHTGKDREITVNATMLGGGDLKSGVASELYAWIGDVVPGDENTFTSGNVLARDSRKNDIVIGGVSVGGPRDLREEYPRVVCDERQVGAVEALIEIREGDRVVMSRRYWLPVPPPFELKMSPDYSFYTNERQIDLTVVPPDEGDYSVRFMLLRDGAEVKPVPDNLLELDLLEPGIYSLHFLVADGGDDKVVHRGMRRIVKREPAANEVKIDNSRRIMMVNGRDFYPFAVTWERPLRLTREVAEGIASQGYNSLSLSFRLNHSLERVEEVLDLVHEAGLRAFFNIAPRGSGLGFCPESVESVLEYFQAFEGHPAVLAFRIIDEPEIKTISLSEIWGLYEYIKERVHYHPVWINYTVHQRFNRRIPSDVYSMDAYPASLQPIRCISTVMNELNRWGEMTGRMTKAYLQTTGHAYFIPREPAPGEFRYMTAAALMAGTGSLCFFAQTPHGKELREEVLAISRAVPRIAPIILSEKWEADAGPAARGLETIYRTCGGRKYIICLNSTPDTRTFELPLAADKNMVLKDILTGEEAARGKESFVDEFAPYDLKVYEVTLT